MKIKAIKKLKLPATAVSAAVDWGCSVKNARTRLYRYYEESLMVRVKSGGMMRYMPSETALVRWEEE